MSVLVDYFAARDVSDGPDALELLAEDVVYHLLPVPGVEWNGVGVDALREDMARLGPAPSSRHEIVTEGRLGRFEVVLGHRIAGQRRLGTFIAIAETGPDSRITKYLGSFLSTTTLIPEEN